MSAALADRPRRWPRLVGWMAHQRARRQALERAIRASYLLARAERGEAILPVELVALGLTAVGPAGQPTVAAACRVILGLLVRVSLAWGGPRPGIAGAHREIAELVRAYAGRCSESSARRALGWLCVQGFVLSDANYRPSRVDPRGLDETCCTYRPGPALLAAWAGYRQKDRARGRSPSDSLLKSQSSPSGEIKDRGSARAPVRPEGAESRPSGATGSTRLCSSPGCGRTLRARRNRTGLCGRCNRRRIVELEDRRSRQRRAEAAALARPAPKAFQPTPEASEAPPPAPPSPDEIAAVRRAVQGHLFPAGWLDAARALGQGALFDDDGPR